MTPETARNPFRCFDLRFLARALGIGVGIVLLSMVGKGFERGSGPRYLVALGQGLLMALLIVLMVRAIRRLDEMHLRIHLEALGLAFATTAVVAVTTGFLEKAGMPTVPWGEAAWPVMTGTWAVAVVIVRRRYA